MATWGHFIATCDSRREAVYQVLHHRDDGVREHDRDEHAWDETDGDDEKP